MTLVLHSTAKPQEMALQKRWVFDTTKLSVTARATQAQGPRHCCRSLEPLPASLRPVRITSLAKWSRARKLKYLVQSASSVSTHHVALATVCPETSRDLQQSELHAVQEEAAAPEPGRTNLVIWSAALPGESSRGRGVPHRPGAAFEGWQLALGCSSSASRVWEQSGSSSKHS